MTLWITEWLIGLVGRTQCRLFRAHNVTCRGRKDHVIPGVGLIDPDRWNGWPR